MKSIQMDRGMTFSMSKLSLKSNVKKHVSTKMSNIEYLPNYDFYTELHSEQVA